jgi:NADH dehydrogenase
VTAAGRVKVEADCSLPGRPEVFVVGDLAHFERNGANVTGVAPAAIQMARFAARCIRGDLAGKARRHFDYFDKGTAATIGRAAAVARSGHLRISGFPAWGVWVLLHIIYLTTFRNRIAVTAQWVTAWMTGRKGVRLVTHDWTPLGDVDTAAPQLRAAASPSR